MGGLYDAATLRALVAMRESRSSICRNDETKSEECLPTTEGCLGLGQAVCTDMESRKAGSILLWRICPCAKYSQDVVDFQARCPVQAGLVGAHAGSQTRVTSMGGLV